MRFTIRIYFIVNHGEDNYNTTTTNRRTLTKLNYEIYTFESQCSYLYCPSTYIKHGPLSIHPFIISIHCLSLPTKLSIHPFYQSIHPTYINPAIYLSIQLKIMYIHYNTAEPHHHRYDCRIMIPDANHVEQKRTFYFYWSMVSLI